MKKYFLLLILSVAYNSYGQSSLSLSDAIAQGLGQNYDIRIERKNVATNQNNNDWGEAGRYPSVTVNVAQNNSYTDNVKVAFPTATQGQTSVASVQPGVAVNWNIFQGFRANISKERLEGLQAESEGNAEVVIQNNVQSIVLGYYLAVLEYERLEQFAKQLQYSKDRYEFEKVKVEIGSSNTADLLLEQGNMLTDSINWINQRTTYTNAVRNLNFLMGEKDISRMYEFTDGLEQTDDVGTLGELTAQLQENADLRTIYLSQAILNHNKSLARADRMPTLSLSAGFNDNRQNLNLSNARFFTGDFSDGNDGFASGPADPLSSVTDTYFANFTLSFNLFDGGRINRAIRNAVIQEDIGSLRIERLESSLNRDLQNAYQVYTDRQQLLGINEERERIAARNLEISLNRLKGGTINSFDYRVIQNNYLQSSTQKLQALYNLIDTKITILRLTGGLVETYMQ